MEHGHAGWQGAHEYWQRLLPGVQGLTKESVVSHVSSVTSLSLSRVLQGRHPLVACDGYSVVK